MADRFTIVRSYGSGQSGHTYGEVVSGRNPSGASISSIYARVRGNNHPQTGLPTNVLVLPEAVKDGLVMGGNFETSALPTLTQPGSLGPTYAAFNPSGGGELKRDMELAIAPARLEDRRTLLLGLDQLRRQADSRGMLAGIDTYRPAHLLGTILHTLFDVGRLRLEPQVPREIIRFADTAQTIDQLHS